MVNWDGMSHFLLIKQFLILEPLLGDFSLSGQGAEFLQNNEFL